MILNQWTDIGRGRGRERERGRERQRERERQRQRQREKVSPFSHDCMDAGTYCFKLQRRLSRALPLQQFLK